MPSGRPSSSCTARAQASSASRSMPVSWPISWSIETRSSLATLPVAPAGTGQPPSSPKEDSNERTPASRAASALASPWPRVLWKWAVSSTPGRRSKARREELAHLGRVGHAGGVAEADLGHARGGQPVGDGEHGLGLDRALVGAAEGHRDHRGHAQVLGQRALGHALQAGQRLLDRPVHVGPVVRLGGRQEQVGLVEVLAQARARCPARARWARVRPPRPRPGTSMAASTSAASASWGITSARTKLVTSSRRRPGAGQLVDQRDLGRGGDDLGLVLEPVARADLADGDGVGHA